MSVWGELEVPPNDGELSRWGLKTVPDRERLEGTHRVLKSCEGARLGAGAVNDGGEGLVGTDPLENGLERIVAGGRLGLAEGLDGDIERGALGVNDGLDGAAARGGLNDGLEGAIEGDLPELDGEPELRDGPGLGLGLMASRLAAMPFTTALRSEPPRAAITLGVVCRRLDRRRPASEKPAW